MADKIAGLRVLADAAGKMNLALADVGGAILVISQFTLYGDATAGRRPSFLAAAPGPIAEPLYERFIALLRERGCTVETGAVRRDERSRARERRTHHDLARAMILRA